MTYTDTTGKKSVPDNKIYNKKFSRDFCVCVVFGSGTFEYQAFLEACVHVGQTKTQQIFDLDINNIAL